MLRSDFSVLQGVHAATKMPWFVQSPENRPARNHVYTRAYQRSESVRS